MIARWPCIKGAMLGVSASSAISTSPPPHKGPCSLADRPSFGYDISAMKPAAGALAGDLLKRIRCLKSAAAAFELLMLCALPGTLQAQVFIASKPHPDFWIAPVFISANVGRQDVARDRGPVTLNVSWSVAPPPDRDPATIAQDLYLLWPGELAGTAGGGADPLLARQVEGAGFQILAHGQLHLAARNRNAMGTGASAGIRGLGEAPFVTFARPDGLARGARPASYIRIPWKPELASLDWLAHLELPVKGAIATKQVSWLEETFWGRRYIITMSFGDVGYSSLYPLYFANRDRLVPLAPDFSMLLINFADSGHLKVDEVVPTSANRRKSETRPDTETISIPLVAAEGLVPHALKVQFAYFRGRLPWQPILFSALLLGLGNLTGPLVGALLRRIARTLRARVHVGRGTAPDRESGMVPPKEALARIRPGETTYEEVLRVCGPSPDEEARLPSGEPRMLVYRGQRLVPQGWRSFGWFGTVSHWDVEHHEVQIDFEHDRVRDIQARVRRSRVNPQPL
jgi:hypothetical protein